MSRPIRSQGKNFYLLIILKNTKLVKDNEDLLLVKFHQILLNGCRGEVEKLTAHQRPWRPSLLADQLENTSLAEDIKYFLPIILCHNLFRSFREEVEKVACIQMPDSK